MNRKPKNKPQKNPLLILLIWMIGGMAVTFLVFVLFVQFGSYNASSNGIIAFEIIVIGILSTSIGLIFGLFEQGIMSNWLKLPISDWKWKTPLTTLITSVVSIFIVTILPFISPWWIVMALIASAGLLQYLDIRHQLAKANGWLGAHILGGLIIVGLEFYHDLTVEFPEDICTYGYEEYCLSGALVWMSQQLEIFFFGVFIFWTLAGIASIRIYRAHHRQQVANT